MKKANVLMLGWEYPPSLAGGLGVASEALARALAQTVDLSLITPAWDGLPDLPWLKGLEFPGLVSDQPFINPYPYPYQEIQWKTPFEKVAEPPRMEPAAPAGESPEPEAKEVPEKNPIIRQTEAYASEVVAEAASLPFDIIHVHDWLTALPGLALQEATGKPLVLHVHALEYDRSGPDTRGWIYALECEALKRADLIIPVSQYMGAVLQDHYGIDPQKIKPVHHGSPEIKPYRLESPFGGPVVTFVGRLAGQKNPWQVLELAQAVLAERPEVTFVLAGEGPEREALLRETINRGLELNVLFTGFLGKEPLHDLLAISDVFFMPSWSEPFGLAALEAASFGVPCILSDRCGVAEVLHSAWLTAPDNIGMQVKLCLELLAHPELRASLGKRLKEEANSFRWADAAEQIEDLYKSLGA